MESGLIMHSINRKIQQIARRDCPNWMKDKQYRGWTAKLARVASVRAPIAGHEAHWRQSGLPRHYGPDTQAGQPHVRIPLW